MKKFFKRKAQFYYVRNNGHRVGTVCLYEVPGTKGIFCRGISICSVHDNFNAEMGKEEALERCHKAYLTQENSEPITLNTFGDGRAITILRFALNFQGYKGYSMYKSAYTNRLSEFERKIMSVRKQMEERRAR
jgi:hypothetical protein